MGNNPKDYYFEYGFGKFLKIIFWITAIFILATLSNIMCPIDEYDAMRMQERHESGR